MIALRGENTPEEVFLNLGGMFAAGVAVVPTSRGADYRTAIEACRQPDRTPRAPYCPTVRALEQATRANIENSLVALVGVAPLALAATWFLGEQGYLAGRRHPRRRLPLGFWTSVPWWPSPRSCSSRTWTSSSPITTSSAPSGCSSASWPWRSATPSGGRASPSPAPDWRWRAQGCAPASPRCGRRAVRRPNLYAGFAWALLSLPSWA